MAGGCALLLVFALTGGALCFGLGTLLFRGEIRLPGAEPAQSRLWLVRERENQGLAFSTSRLASGSRESGRACFETRVSFFLWRSDGTAQATRYCQCYERSERSGREGPAWLLAGDCPP
jgi:hypothetical protein